MKQIEYNTCGTCCKHMTIILNDDNTVNDVKFLGGCPGNTVGIANMIKGMAASDVVNKLSGIKCGRNITSCPDQLANALKQYTNEN